MLKMPRRNGLAKLCHTNKVRKLNLTQKKIRQKKTPAPFPSRVRILIILCRLTTNASLISLGTLDASPTEPTRYGARFPSQSKIIVVKNGKVILMIEEPKEGTIIHDLAITRVRLYDIIKAE